MEDEVCKYCLFDEDGEASESLINSGDLVASLEKGRYGYGTWLVVSDATLMIGRDEAIFVNYCPVCGRKL